MTLFSIISCTLCCSEFNIESLFWCIMVSNSSWSIWFDGNIELVAPTSTWCSIISIRGMICFQFPIELFKVVMLAIPCSRTCFHVISHNVFSHWFMITRSSLYACWVLIIGHRSCCLDVWPSSGKTLSMWNYFSPGFCRKRLCLGYSSHLLGNTVKRRCYEYRLDQADLDEVMFTKEDNKLIPRWTKYK